MKYLLVIVFCLLSILSFAQSLNKLHVGAKLPTQIWNKIPQKNGVRLVILDFWDTHCASCISAFPEIEDLQRKFQNQIQIVLVNTGENAKTIKDRLELMNKKIENNNQITLPVGTTSLNLSNLTGKRLETEFDKLFPHLSVPHHVWINQDKKVIAITGPYNATTKNIRLALKGEKLNFLEKDENVVNDLIKKGLMQSRNSALKPVYYSAFMHSVQELGGFGETNIDSALGVCRETWAGYTTIQLYRIPFPKIPFSRIIFEASDTNMLRQPIEKEDRNDWYNKYKFSYEVQYSLKDKSNRQNLIQNDLNKYLGSELKIIGLIEKRKFKSFILIKKKDGLLKSAGISEDTVYDTARFVIKNRSFSDLLEILQDNLETISKNGKGEAFVNETNIDDDFLIDFSLLGNIKNIESLKLQLQNYGLDLIAEEREIEVLVIKNIP